LGENDMSSSFDGSHLRQDSLTIKKHFSKQGIKQSIQTASPMAAEK